MVSRLDEVMEHARNSRQNPAPLGTPGSFDSAGEAVSAVANPRRLPPWQTGGGIGFRENGFSTSWMSKWRKQFQDAADRKDPYSMYSRSDFTGVYLHDTGENQRNYGDIYDEGRYQGNIRTLMGDDVANQLLAQFQLDPNEQADVYRGLKKKPEKLLEALEADRSRRTADYENYRAAKKQDERLAKWETEYDSNPVLRWADRGMRLITGTMSGIGQGAAVGSAFGGVGALPGAVGGGLYGFGSSIAGMWMNADQQRRETAETLDAMEQAWQQGGLSGIGSAATALGGRVADDLNPMSDVIQGSADAYYGEIGDSQRTWQDAHWGWKAADIGSHVVSAFGLGGVGVAKGALGVARGGSALRTTLIGGRELNAAGVTILNSSSYTYGAAMATSATGKVLQVADGAVWDDATGEFKELDSVGQYSAALGSAAIDAVQMGRPAALLEKAASRVMRVGNAGAPRATTETIAGWRFTTDATGNVSAKMNWSAYVAPSELVAALNTRMLVFRSGAATSATTLTADKIRRAAVAIERGERPVNSILVNAIGEGFEEATQGVLDAVALDRRIDPQEILLQAAYGAAMGGGMTTGHLMSSLGGRQADWVEYVSSSLAANTPMMEKAEFYSLSAEERALKLAAFDPMHQAVGQTLTDRALKRMAHQALSSDSAFADAVFSQLRSDASGATQGKPGLITMTTERLNTNIPQDGEGLSLFHYAKSLESRVESLNAFANQREADGFTDEAADIREMTALVARLSEGVNQIAFSDTPTVDKVAAVNHLIGGGR